MADPHDEIAEVLAAARAELDAERSDGRAVPLDGGAVERHFAGVVEAVDAGLVEQPDLEVRDLARTAQLPTWRVSGGGLLRRLVGYLLAPLLSSIGTIVRRQVAPFTIEAGHLVMQTVERQNRLRHFLLRSHLERVASLEERVVELEHELARLRSDRAPADGEV